MDNNFIALAHGFTCDGTFRFGKHKGKSYVEVATDLKEPDYFLWLRENLKGRLDAELNKFIEDNLDKLKSLPKTRKIVPNRQYLGLNRANYLIYGTYGHRPTY